MVSEREIQQAIARRDRWIQTVLGRKQALFLAACVTELSEAFGGQYGEWGTLTETERTRVLQHFATYQSSVFARLQYTFESAREALPARARQYQEDIEKAIGAGHLRAFAADLANYYG